MHSAIWVYEKYPQVEREALLIRSILLGELIQELETFWSDMNIRLLLDYKMPDLVRSLLLLGTAMHKMYILSWGNWCILDEG